MQFVWRVTRGHRLRPWRHPLIAWRIETYTGVEASRVGAREFFAFCWLERQEVARFLRWTGQMNGYRRQSLHPGQSANAGPGEAG